MAWFFLAVGLYGAACVPYFLLVDADHLTPEWARRLPLTAAALLMLLGGPDGA